MPFNRNIAELEFFRAILAQCYGERLVLRWGIFFSSLRDINPHKINQVKANYKAKANNKEGRVNINNHLLCTR